MFVKYRVIISSRATSAPSTPLVGKSPFTSSKVAPPSILLRASSYQSSIDENLPSGPKAEPASLATASLSSWGNTLCIPSWVVVAAVSIVRGLFISLTYIKGSSWYV